MGEILPLFTCLSVLFLSIDVPYDPFGLLSLISPLSPLLLSHSLSTVGKHYVKGKNPNTDKRVYKYSYAP
jgi:hypothetical protein